MAKASTASPTVVATIPVNNPNGVAYDSGMGEVFVTSLVGTASVISDVTNTAVATIPVGASGPYGIGVAYDSGMGEVFVTNFGVNTVSVISDVSNTVVATIPVGLQPLGVAYDSKMGEVFVTNINSNTVSVISDVTNTVVATVSAGANPYGVAYDSGMGEVFVTNYSPGGTVSVISDATNTVVVTTTVGAFPLGVAYDSGKGEVFVTDPNGGPVSVISDVTNNVVATIPVGLGSIGVAYDSGMGEVFVTNEGGGSVSVISDVTNTVVATVTVDSGPLGVAYDGGRGEIFVANSGSNTVSVISDGSMSVVHTTSTTVTCSPASVPVNASQAICIATVTDTSTGTQSAPTGTVDFTTSGTGTFQTSPCTLGSPTANSASCSAGIYTPTVIGTGTHTITGTYSSDATHAASSGTFDVTVSKRGTAISPDCTPLIVPINSPTTCTALVQSDLSISVPTGTVTFTSSGAGTFTGSPCTLGNPTDHTAICQVTYSPTAAGTHMITETYSGDSGHSGSSVTFDLTVTTPLHSTTTSVTCDSAVIVNQSPNCTATVADTSGSPTTPSGTVTFSADGSATGHLGLFGPCDLSPGTAAGTATCSAGFPTYSAQTVSVSATYAPSATDTTHSGSSSTVSATITVSLRATSTTVTCDTPVTVGTASSCTATVMDTSTAGTALTPTGVVVFSATGTATGTFPLSHGTCAPSPVILGTASCSVNFTPSITGTAMISASFAPTVNPATNTIVHSGSSTTTAFSITVTPPPPHTSTTSVSCDTPVVVNQASTCTATVTDTDASPTAPTGTVIFTLTGTATGTLGPNCSLTGSVSPTTCTVSFLPSGAGTAGVSGSYGGDSTHNPSATAAAFNITVNLRTTSTLVSCASPVLVDTAAPCVVTLADTSTAGTAITPTGSFNLGTSSTGSFSGPCALSQTVLGTASCAVTYTPSVAGTHIITANYPGDLAHSSSSGTASITVNVVVGVPTVTVNSPTPNPANTGATVTVTFTVSSTATVTGVTVGWGDGTTPDSLPGNAVSDTHLYASTGNVMSQTFTITVTATNSAGTGSATIQETVTAVTGNPVQLTFQGFDLDDFDNGVGQLQVFVNGNLVADVPAGLNHLTGGGDYMPYMNKWVSFGPFDITSFIVQGQNTIVFLSPPPGHFGLVKNVTVTQGNTLLLRVAGARSVSLSHPVKFTFSIPSLAIASFTISSNNPLQDQLVTFTTTYTGGTGPFTCTFRFGDDESVTVLGSSGSCSVTHDYDDTGTFNARVVIRGSSTSDVVSATLIVRVAGASNP